MTRACALAGLLLGMPALATAQEFSWQAGALTRWGTESNPGLQAEAGDRSWLGHATATFGLARQTEVARTRLDLELTGTEGARRVDGGSDRGSQGRATLQHSYRAPLDSWSLGAGYRRERTLDTQLRASDVVLGNTRRSAVDGSLGWTHTFSERLSLQTQLQWSGNSFDAAGEGSNYRVGSGSVSLQQAWSETMALSLSLGRTGQQRGAGDGRVGIDTLRLGWSQSLNERWKAGASLGGSETTRTAVTTRLACPLPASYCDAGLVRPIVVRDELTRRSHDSQFSADVSWRWSELGDASARASRALNPGAFGVTREDALSLAVSAVVSDRLSGRLGLDLSISLRPAEAASALPTRARLATWTLILNQRLAERWQLEWQVLQRNYDAGAPQIQARSNRFSITLQYLGPTVSGLR